MCNCLVVPPIGDREGMYRGGEGKISKESNVGR